MILLEDILKVHQFSIDRFGGGTGVRDLGGVASAIARPFQTFGGNDLYPSVFEKAAALGESLIVNHPFIDGNKRTGFLAMASFMAEEGYFLKATQEDAYNFTIQIASGIATFDQIVVWLKENCSPA